MLQSESEIEVNEFANWNGAALINDKQLQAGFELARFIHKDERLSLEIVGEAIKRLERRNHTERKRLYYKAESDAKFRGITGRSKPPLQEADLLQLLIFRVSETYEKEYETGIVEFGGPEQRRLVTHLIKHLSLMTLERNSFYVALGKCRLLYQIDLRETISIYARIIDDPGRIKDESYWRARKAFLLKALVDRFSGLISLKPSTRGHEAGLLSEPATRELSAHAERCFELFSPWEVTCPMGGYERDGEYEPPTYPLDLRDEKNGPTVDLKRSHLIMHPACFEKLTLAAGLGPAADRLQIPIFRRWEV